MSGCEYVPHLSFLDEQPVETEEDQEEQYVETPSNVFVFTSLHSEDYLQLLFSFAGALGSVFVPWRVCVLSAWLAVWLAG